MKNTTEMRREKAALVDQSRALLSKAEAEGRGQLSKTEQAEFDGLMDKIDRQGIEIVTEERMQREELMLATPVNDGGWYSPSGSVPVQIVPPGQPEPRDYRSLFYGNRHAPLDNGGFENWKEFIEVIRSGKYDPRLEKRQFTGSDADLGGYSMPEELISWLMDKSLENEIVRPRATIYPMAARTRRIPAWAGETHTGEAVPLQLFGGFTPVWMEEAGAQVDQIATLRQIVLTAYKLGIYASASNELAADGLDFDRQLSEALTRAVSFTLDYYYLRGDGSDKPLGVLNCPSLITVPRTGPDGIVYQDVINMYSRLHPVAAGKALWVANHETMPQLLSMVDPSDHLVWSPNAREGVPGNLLGLPLLRTEKLPGLGTEGDLILVDFSHYAIGIRKEMAIERSNAPGWANDLMSYRVLLRTDGEDTWESAITPVEGTDTLSWCIALGVPSGS